LHQRASDKAAQEELEKSARQLTAGTISSVRGHLDLCAGRTVRHINSGKPFHPEIERAMNSAVKEGLLRLKKQRIESKSNPRISAVRFSALKTCQAFGASMLK
jgi:hypothetical protein